MARVSRRARGSVARRSRRARGSVARRSRRARGSVARRGRGSVARRSRRAQGKNSLIRKAVTKTGKAIGRTGKAIGKTIGRAYTRMETNAGPRGYETSNGWYNNKTGKTRPLPIGPSPF